MTKELLKEKRLFFLFSKLKDKEANKTHFSLIVDTFINKKNSFLNLIEIAQELNNIGINIKPESLISILENKIYTPYFELPEIIKIDKAFKLKKLQYDTLSSYQNYYDKLDEYVVAFLKKEKLDTSRTEVIKEILLTTLFNRNLVFLKQLISSKDANELESLLVLNKNGKFTDEEYGIYNNMILTSDEKLNEIIRILLYKIFDFLQLHYNPNIDKTLNDTYKNKTFYLDSSFIIRLFGFDNEIREHRALELVGILKNIEGVKFVVHNKTLTETQNNIKNIIDRVQKILGHSDKALNKIQNLNNKKNDTIDLYLRLKQKRKIVGKEDFILHFNNVLIKLKSIIGSNLIERDDKRIKTSSDKVETLLNELSQTIKTSSRIKHISEILLYIESLRGSNIYNLYDIKHWLLTTDNTTLQIDAKIRNLNEDNSKSVCILPTELLRTISNKTEIASDYIEVFKQFMVYSNAYAEQYSEEELETIDNVITLAESANNEEYDVDYYINNLFDEISLEELVNRLNKVEEKEKRDLELVKVFEETFGGVYREKYLKLIEGREKTKSFIIKLVRYLIIFILPVIILIYFLFKVVNPEIDISDPMTYVIEERWSKLGFMLTIIEVILVPSALLINSKYGLKLEKWLNKK